MWSELLGTTTGQLSLGVIVGVVIIGIVMVSFYSKKMDEDARNAKKD
ncbi:hypothetical protein AGMMS49545_13710 [Betaproteobacteria bacterium]|nr:hypothetical protein AGMMS49545_13710 [Betaproteobacteria bacterium]GHU15388.1 hypothetical protein FACS189441_6990 [Betaproteobacteria bacterium]GHU45440.1 hypothetical protein AGMMS50289_16660 [Betaproteobacteria bacterium]